MPFTPFHWSILILGVIFLNFFSLPALAIASVLMDVEPFYLIFIAPRADGQLHLFLHTYLGATLIALVVGFGVSRYQEKLNSFLQHVGLAQKLSSTKIYFSSFIGAYSHIFLDSLMHPDMESFWPAQPNPFLGLLSSSFVYNVTGAIILLTIIIGVIRIIGKFR